MIVKTKKFALDPKQYVNISFKRHMTKEWKWLLIPAAVFLLGLVLHFTGAYKNWWIPVVAVVGGGLYVLFWYIQFYAASQMEQNKQMFDKFMYEIDSRQILVKINAKEGGIMKWDTIQSAERTEDAILLIIGKGQFLRFPSTVFNSEHDLKLFESILKRKELL
ncbi:MAG: YcxB family protein [Emticicia sp.]|nr:YcxB family protein [Emticicia sp.]